MVSGRVSYPPGLILESVFLWLTETSSGRVSYPPGPILESVFLWLIETSFGAAMWPLQCPKPLNHFTPVAAMPRPHGHQRGLVMCNRCRSLTRSCGQSRPETHRSVLGPDRFSGRDSSSKVEWARRFQHRFAAAAHVYASDAYAMALCYDPDLRGIEHPDPSDRTISKRHWEYNMRTFSEALRAKVLLCKLGMHGAGTFS